MTCEFRLRQLAQKFPCKIYVRFNCAGSRKICGVKGSFCGCPYAFWDMEWQAQGNRDTWSFETGLCVAGARDRMRVRNRGRRYVLWTLPRRWHPWVIWRRRIAFDVAGAVNSHHACYVLGSKIGAARKNQSKKCEWCKRSAGRHRRHHREGFEGPTNECGATWPNDVVAPRIKAQKDPRPRTCTEGLEQHGAAVQWAQAPRVNQQLDAKASAELRLRTWKRNLVEGPCSMQCFLEIMYVRRQSRTACGHPAWRAETRAKAEERTQAKRAKRRKRWARADTDTAEPCTKTRPKVHTPFTKTWTKAAKERTREKGSGPMSGKADKGRQERRTRVDNGSAKPSTASTEGGRRVDKVRGAAKLPDIFLTKNPHSKLDRKMPKIARQIVTRYTFWFLTSTLDGVLQGTALFHLLDNGDGEVTLDEAWHWSVNSRSDCKINVYLFYL